MTRDELKKVVAHLAAQFDSMPTDLWDDTVKHADVDVSCVVGAKKVTVRIESADDLDDDDLEDDE